MPLSFRIAGWTAWPAEEVALPMALRRRASAVGQRALKTALAALPADAAPRYVLSSRHGEISRTTGLLTALAEEGEVSPAEFSMAVHHGLAGLLSIHTGNKEGHTAIAAGADSFAYGLIEAATTAAETGRPVLHLHFDEPLPEIYAPVAGEPDDDTVLALLLDPAEGESFALDRAPEAPGTGGLAAGFVDFLRSEAREGGAGAWRWSRHA
jgi:hypothetical protein